MKIAFINSPQASKAIIKKKNILEESYLKDIKLSYDKNKVKLNQLGISRVEYVKFMKQKLGI